MENLIHIEQTIDNLKHPNDFEAIARIPVLRKKNVVAFLRPVPSELKGLAFSDARLMAEWRNIHKTAFFTWITATELSTGKWLTGMYAPDKQDIIFMIETPEHIPFGHVALYNFQSDGSTCEFGRILRGLDIGPSEGMTTGSLALLHWATSELKIKRFFLEVFNDNKRAITFYERIGFNHTSTVPLRKKAINGITCWEKVTEQSGSEPPPDGYALRMEITAKQLHAKIKQIFR